VAAESLYVPPVPGSGLSDDPPYGVEGVTLERTRAVIALALTALLILTVLLAFFWLNGPSWQNAKELLQTVVPVEVGLLGSAIGFYFGSQVQAPS